MVTVVTCEKPLGMRCRNCSSTSRRIARIPELRSGIFWSARNSAILRMVHFAGTRRNLTVPSSLSRAPTTWSWPSRAVTSSGIRWFG